MHENVFVNLKSNSSFLFNKGHNLLTSAFPPKNSPKLTISLLKEKYHFKAELVSFQAELNYCPYCLPPKSGGQARN